MSDLSLKDFEILSEQDQNEALALLSRYDQMENAGQVPERLHRVC
jgi:hypothetical protein